MSRTMSMCISGSALAPDTKDTLLLIVLVAGVLCVLLLLVIAVAALLYCYTDVHLVCVTIFIVYHA